MAGGSLVLETQSRLVMVALVMLVVRGISVVVRHAMIIVRPAASAGICLIVSVVALTDDQKEALECLGSSLVTYK